ncbi:Autophagy protein 7 [Yamadazyma tenuis]|uniref:Ubiquitin-like modifier-activating enzyme ATG7 n=2 Tax=Candida tenuis (strain ATCC 10573 / BCRC 21748 / CBS 615 / JCM 9827 / NBRC 10315 / NRRL Y-1498 / VKM Y-70) TaxID=590646 RepID=G3B863_CANTC|nr:uncharacterized protein CANTEDRAFT_115823 [Yamadazyma tenuis ATCC 10573]EGV62361.1 hypothetical protein CANTEDRAFT_115823 [Yamadazyma tenuis ATCC 10573]WEJ93626.1 Autophagy protein 7 [Yamadazyma tenuis]
MTQLAYVTIQSFVDSSFFTRLSELKINEYKLESKPQLIFGSLTDPQKLTKFNNVPILNLDYNSFEKQDHHNISGYIHNVNTIEEFKSVGKQQLMSEWGQQLVSQLADGNDQGQFHILSFADLKKYKFYYWVAYPTANSDWVVEEQGTSSFEFDFSHQFTKVSESEYAFIDNCLDSRISSQLKNNLTVLALKGVEKVRVHVFKKEGSVFYDLKLKEPVSKESLKVTGWERTSQGKLGPKLANLGSLIDPHQLADQAVDLNLKLMKWRIAPNLNLDIIKDQKVLLLGAGTLGSYVSRALLGWGVRKITFVDNGRISFSNPVRQPLFTFNDCFADNGQGTKKAVRASQTLKEVFPGVDSHGVELEVPMVGHESSEQNYNKLCELFDNHDVVFLLMDSRESRWLPTVLGLAKNKLVINAALGFDSYLVLRHGTQNQDLGCYYCNDVVAPNDSLTDRTLDQMCTVTRPGAALMASSLAVELMVSVLQSAEGKDASANETGVLGQIPHQIRGFLHNFEQMKLMTPRYQFCSACSSQVVNRYKEEGWSFISRCLSDSKFLEDVCGLKRVQEDTERLDELFGDFDLEEEDDGLQ